MNRDGSAVDELLKGALAAGLAPSAVAMWGRGPDIRESIRVGRPRLGPSAVHVTGEIWYDLASLTKPLVTGTLTLLAFRDLGLQPDAVVGTLLDGVGHRSIADVTINQLLSHSSGLPAWEPVYALATSPAEVVEAIAAIELEARPGARVEYSCLGFILLGKILEDLFGEPLDACFRRQVLEPLGLEEMLAFRPDPTARPVAGGSATASPEIEMSAERGFSPEAIPPVNDSMPHDGNARYLHGVAGNSGLFGTARGVFRLASEYLSHGTGLLRPREIAAATTPVAAGAHQVRGLGWQLSLTPGCSAGPRLGTGAFGHVGFTGTSVWVDPDLESVFVLLTNRCHPDYRDVDLHPLRRRFGLAQSGTWYPIHPVNSSGVTVWGRHIRERA